MTKFQTAQEKSPRSPHTFDPSLIHQLHDDPEPFEIDTVASHSATPEELLLIKEALQELNATERFNQFFEIAPTTTNIEERAIDWASITIERS